MATVVVLAGGLATRLRPISETIPKSLIAINQQPFIFHQLRLLKKQGVSKIVLCVGYLGEMIQKVVGDGSSFGCEILYSFDHLNHLDNSNTPLLGTAGAVKRAIPFLEDYFFVLYGDSYLVCDYQKVQNAFLAENKLALMTVYRNQNKFDKSNVEFSNGKLIDYSKKEYTDLMHYIDYGLSVFSKKAFDLVPANTCYDLADLYYTLLKQNEVAGFEIQERFYEIGSFSGINELEVYLSKQ